MINRTSAFMLGGACALLLRLALQYAGCQEAPVDHADAALRERGIAAIANEHARQMRIASELLHKRAPSIARQAAIVSDVAPDAKPVLITHTEISQTATGEAPCLLKPGDKLTLALDIEELRTPTTTALIGEAVVSGPAGEMLRQPIDSTNTRLRAAPQPVRERTPGWGLGIVGAIDSDITPRVGALVVSPGACVGPACARGIASLAVRPGAWDKPALTTGVYVELR